MKPNEVLIEQYNSIPDSIFIISFCVLCVTIVLICFTKVEWNTKFRHVSFALFLEYTFLVLCSTLFFRHTSCDAKYNLDLFWSYKAIAKGEIAYLYEDFLNIVLGLPFGLFFPIIVQKTRWWKVLLFGSCLSLLIETLQLYFHKGLFELDDIFHNTLGCLIGYLIVMSFLSKGRKSCAD